MSSVDPGLSIDARPHFLLALRRILRPIVRLMIRCGIRYDEFAEIARTAYVESAARDGVGGAGPPTVDQIEWATGIERTRVEHYIDDTNALPEPAPISKSTHAMTEVLHKWHTMPRYLESDGSPSELEFDSASDVATFVTLVAEVDVEADPKTILDGLLETNSVRYSDDNRIKALTRALIWTQGGARSIDYFGVTLTRMIETLEHNLASTDSEKKRLERSVFADRGIPSHLVPKFHAFATERATHFLYDLDDWLAQHAPTTIGERDIPKEVGINLFFYIDPLLDTRALSSLAQQPRFSSN